MRWRAEPKTEASVKTHRGTTTTGGLTSKRSDEKLGAKDSSEARAITEQQKYLDQISISHIRAEASFTASLSSTKPSSPSPRILQPNNLRRHVTSSRHRDDLGGGGAENHHALRSCKHRARGGLPEYLTIMVMSDTDSVSLISVWII
ncbi:hypothetical protein ABVT39_025896 [Epinephelus coioides]